ncbi:MAG: protein kinase [Verrucomicrobia bacterium]|nr:protein kinase [Verrucomicrobiota bacterium]
MSTGEPVPRTEPVRFGRYEVARKADGSLEKLGAGAMGVTYKARDTLLQRQVVLKVVNADLLSGDGGAARKRFLREAAAAAQLVHPHVAAVHDIGVEADKDFYVMEFVAGRSLGEEVRNRGHLTVPEVLTIARHVAQALAAAWQHQLVHRDIKPANLMLTHPPENSDAEHNIWVKVIDFGLAKSVRRTGSDEATASMVSVTGAFLGTPAFASPEQLEGRDLDTRTDLYSLGVTMFLALTGELPFTGTTLGQLITGHLAKPPPLHRLRELGVPEPVVGLIGRLLAKEPDGRPADGEALLFLIDEVTEQITPPPEGSLPPPPVESPTLGDPVESYVPLTPSAPLLPPGPVHLPPPPESLPRISPTTQPPAPILPQSPPPRTSPRLPPAPAILPQAPPPRTSPRVPQVPAILPQAPPPRTSPRVPQQPPMAVYPAQAQLPPPPQVEPARPAARDLPRQVTVPPPSAPPPPSTPSGRGFPLVPILGVAGLGLILVLLAVLEPGGGKGAKDEPTPTPRPGNGAVSGPTPQPTSRPQPTAAQPTPAPSPGPKKDAFGSIGEVRRADGIPITDAVLEAERLAPTDMNAALTVLDRAANAGDVAAMSMLGAAYMNGSLFRPDRPGVALPGGRNPELGYRWAKAAMDQGDSRSLVTVANAYIYGQGVLRDPRRGLELAAPAADRGEPIAQLLMALAYSNGQPNFPVQRDPVRARYFIERSASTGYTAGRAFLGAWLTVGLNVPSDPARGIRMLEDAERDGSVIALFQLGLAYYNGNGVPKSYDRAVSYYRRAARASYEPAEQELRRLGETP